MAPTEWKSDFTLRELLEQKGHTFDFSHAITLIHRLNPEAVPIGELGPPNKEPVRLAHDPALTFHTSDIRRIATRRSTDGGSFLELTSTFLGLFGSVSPLATAMAEEVIDAVNYDERALLDFYNLFHHRILSLFFRATRKYRFDSSVRRSRMNVLNQRMFSFVGIDALGALPQNGLPISQLLSFAPMLTNRTRPAFVLRSALEKLFPEAAVRIECFVSRRADLQVDQRFYLGRRNSTLSRDTTIGSRICDRGGRFRIHMEGIRYQTFTSLMPDGNNYAKIRGVIEQFSHGILEAELELALSLEQSPYFLLGSRFGGQLGVTTMLHRSQMNRPLRVRMLLSDDARNAQMRGIVED